MNSELRLQRALGPDNRGKSDVGCDAWVVVCYEVEVFLNKLGCNSNAQISRVDY